MARPKKIDLEAAVKNMEENNIPIPETKTKKEKTKINTPSNIPGIMKSMKIRLTFEEEVLGGQPPNDEVYKAYFAPKAPSQKEIDEELEALKSDKDGKENQITIFPKDKNGDPIFFNYQVRGFFKEACSNLRKVPGTMSSTRTAFKKEIDGLIFVQPRQIPINIPEGESLTTCARILRAQTMQGERTMPACSEAIPAGSFIEFEVLALRDEDLDIAREWLSYGMFKGLGQWRNSGKGSFTFEEITE